MKLPINAHVIKAFSQYVAPKDEIRYCLNGVLIETTPNAVYYVATNGHMLACWREARAESEPLQVIIPRTVGMKLKVARRMSGSFIEGSVLSISGENIPFIPVDGKFPQWRRVIPASVSDKLAPFNPAYLAALANACSAACNLPAGNTMATYTLHNGESAGLVLALKCPEFVGVCMPIREHMDREPIRPSIPEWANTCE